MSSFSFHEVVPADADELTASSEKEASAAWLTQDDFELAMFNEVAASTAKQGKFTSIGTMANLEDRRIVCEEQWRRDKPSFVTQYNLHLTDAYLDRIRRDYSDQSVGVHASRILSLRIDQARTPKNEFGSGSPKTPIGTTAKNRRYAKLKQLFADGNYFSDESIMQRNARLYRDHMAAHLRDSRSGLDETLSYIDNDGNQERSASSAREVQLGEALFDANSALRSFPKASSESHREPCESSPTQPAHAETGVTASYRVGAVSHMSDGKDPEEIDRAQLVRAAAEQFLLGFDGEFVNYDEIDRDPDLDNLDDMSRRAEEAYFDY